MFKTKKMKLTLSILISIFFTFNIYSQFTKQDFKEIGSALKQYKNIQGRYDKHNNVLWIRRIDWKNSLKNTAFGGGLFYLYFGLKKVNGEFVKTKMRINVTYLGSNWLFIDKISFALLTLEEGDENLVQTFSMKCSNPTRTVRGTNVEEICDMVLPKEGFEFFKQMTELKRMTTIRLSGEKYIESAMFRKKLNNYDQLIKAYENEFKFE